MVEGSRERCESKKCNSGPKAAMRKQPNGTCIEHYAAAKREHDKFDDDKDCNLNVNNLDERIREMIYYNSP